MNLFNTKLTSLEKKWALYDVGNSAWILLAASILPILFGSLTKNANIDSETSLSYYAFSISIATLIAAFIGPIVGALSDIKGYRKKVFITIVSIGTIGCFALGFINSWIIFLLIFIVIRVCFSSSLVVNDAMLVDVTTEDRYDIVSSIGYAFGYIGSVIPFTISLGIILGRKFIGISMSTALILAFTLTAIWWFTCSLPLYKSYEHKTYSNNMVKNPFKNIINTIREISNQKKIFIFLLAYFFYIDGVYTIIDLAAKFGDSLGLDSNGLLASLLVTNIVAFPASIIMGRLSKKVGISALLKISIFAYVIITIVAMLMNSIVHFFILAILVGLFQGGIQAFSRSYFIKIIPSEKSGEYFGIYDICGKSASFLGTTTFAVVTQLTQNQSIGIGAISTFFFIGFVLFNYAEKLNHQI